MHLRNYKFKSTNERKGRVTLFLLTRKKYIPIPFFKIGINSHARHNHIDILFVLVNANDISRVMSGGGQSCLI